jgi:gamma-glutamyltranspeptidase/glutathione hydrolase
MQMAIRLFGAGIDPGEAQQRPRWMIDQFEASQPEIALEDHTPSEVEVGLRGRGHRVVRRQETQHGWGPVSVITVNQDGLRNAAADPRVATAAAAVA